MAHTLTIDNYGVTAHERYASDKSALEALEINLEEADGIPKHFELAGSSILIRSKWEELFETHLHQHPFATFVPPPKFAAMRKRLFSGTLSSKFNWNEADEDDEETEEQKQIEEYRNKIQSKESKVLPIALLEKDRSALLSLFDSIQTLNGFLREIHARKLQYQKG